MQIPGFEVYQPSTDRSLIIATSGLQKRGKTHFALTAPGPIAVISLDIGGIRDVADKFKNKTIYRYEVKKPDKSDNADWKGLLAGIQERYFRVLDNKMVQTIVMDTGSDMWEIFRMAHLGRLEKVPPLKYTELNRDFADFIRAAYDSHCNLILTHKVKKEYVSKPGSDMGSWNGKYERAGFGDIDFLAQIVLEHDRVTTKDENGTPSTEFIVRILDCRINPSVIGMELQGPDMCTFEFLKDLVYA